MTKKEDKELREMLTALLEMGYTKEEILTAFTSAIEEKVEQAERDNSLLVKRQPPAVKAGNFDV